MARAKAKAPVRRRRSRGAAHVRHNRAVWDRVSAGYDRRHGHVLGGRSAAAWGTFRAPESTLRLLGPVRGRDLLELGCGAARWSIAIARQGGRPVGLDLSQSQLARARELRAEAGVGFPLIRASAERLPFENGTFDLVFCDFGAMTFANPRRTVPEAARVLRSGGAFVFATASAFRNLTLDLVADRQTRRLRRPYFGMERIDMGKDAAVEFQLPYGAWIDLFRESGLRVERLVETRPRPGQRSTYFSRADAEWGRSWPLESIWKVVKE